MVVIFLASITLACLNHLSDCDNLMVLPSAALSPNLAKASNCSFSAALSTGGDFLSASTLILGGSSSRNRPDPEVFSGLEEGI